MTVVSGVRLVSNSEVQTFKDCPRRWWLAWYRGLKPREREVVGARSTGTRIHISLAELYKPGGTQRLAIAELFAAQLGDREELEAQQARIAFSEDSSDVSVAAMEKQFKNLNNAFDLERAMIDGYLDWLGDTGVDSQLEVISAEQRIEVDFPAKLRYPVKLIAKIDARVRSVVTGAIKFIDHKTVGSLHDPILGINQQMLHYHVIEDLLTEPDQPRAAGALYNMLRKVKRTRASTPPYYARLPIDHNRFELDGYKRQLHGVIARIEQTETDLEDAGVWGHQVIVPPRPSRDCAWKCDFFKICRMFDDGSRVEAAIDEHYVIGDPLSYYDSEEKSE